MYRREQAAAEPDDLLTAVCGKLSDMGLRLRQPQLGLEPEVCLPFAHEAAFPKAVQDRVGLDALVASIPSARVPMGRRVPRWAAT